MVGDWNGDGRDSVGVFDPSTATWYLRNTPTQGCRTTVPSKYAAPGWTPVVGDWSGTGNTSLGVVNPAGNWYLRNTPTQGPPTTTPFQYGGAGWNAFFMAGGTSQTGGSGQPGIVGQPSNNTLAVGAGSTSSTTPTGTTGQTGGTGSTAPRFRRPP